MRIMDELLRLIKFPNIDWSFGVWYFSSSIVFK